MHDEWSNGNVRQVMGKLGTLGDTVDFAGLPPEVRTEPMAAAVGSKLLPADPTHEVCGSRGEVRNQPTKGHRFQHYMHRNFRGWWLEGFYDLHTRYHSRDDGKQMVWASIAIKAADQLRQRVAWALSQVLVVSERAFSLTHQEAWLGYQDIFVAHAFGNYRDVLREVSYSPIMGRYLTYEGSKSAFASGGFAPDENYAREVMQVRRDRGLLMISASFT